MTDEVRVIGREYSRGPQRWRVDSEGNWTVLMWGWWPGNNGRPEHRWMPIERKKVPDELIRKGSNDG